MRTRSRLPTPRDSRGCTVLSTFGDDHDARCGAREPAWAATAPPGRPVRFRAFTHRCVAGVGYSVRAEHGIPLCHVKHRSPSRARQGGWLVGTRSIRSSASRLACGRRDLKDPRETRPSPLGNPALPVSPHVDRARPSWHSSPRRSPALHVERRYSAPFLRAANVPVDPDRPAERPDRRRHASCLSSGALAAIACLAGGRSAEPCIGSTRRLVVRFT